MNKKVPYLGKYILDSLSIGMYNHPFLVLREYIQNSTDALDELIKKSGFNGDKGKIEIHVDGRLKNLTILDNGIGVTAQNAWHILHDVGKSIKRVTDNRGFRGIGRLGGLGYCKELHFITKAKDERIYSISRWDCDKLRKIIKEENEIDTSEIIREITDFRQVNYEKDPKDHFFMVKMINLQSSRDFLLNVPAIKSFLSVVGPVPLNKSIFKHAYEIEKELKRNVPNYDTYNVSVNDEKIFKPYCNSVILRGKNKDYIDEIEFLELKGEFGILAFTWIANLKLLGTISKSSLVDGVRVRSGNILIGDKNLLSDFYRETRFNNYLLGEIHIIEERLIPNSRRDDFEDNEIREDFYDSFIRNIGLPFSRRIRQLSLERSKQNRIEKENNIFERAESIINRGYFTSGQQEKMINDLWQLRNNNGDYSEFIDRLVKSLKQSKHFLDRNKEEFTENKIKFLKSAFKIVYNESLNKQNAEKIIEKIINEFEISNQ